jgi:hypothetical protein
VPRRTIGCRRALSRGSGLTVRSVARNDNAVNHLELAAGSKVDRDRAAAWASTTPGDDFARCELELNPFKRIYPDGASCVIICVIAIGSDDSQVREHSNCSSSEPYHLRNGSLRGDDRLRASPRMTPAVRAVESAPDTRSVEPERFIEGFGTSVDTVAAHICKLDGLG